MSAATARRAGCRGASERYSGLSGGGPLSIAPGSRPSRVELGRVLAGDPDRLLVADQEVDAVGGDPLKGVRAGGDAEGLQVDVLPDQ